MMRGDDVTHRSEINDSILRRDVQFSDELHRICWLDAKK